MQPHPNVEATPEGASIGSNASTLRAASVVLAGGMLPDLEARSADAAEVDRIRQEVRDLRDDLVKTHLQTGAKVSGQPAAVLRIVRSGAIYRGRTGFNDSASIAQFEDTLRRLMAAGQPLFLAIPLGGAKAPNEAKTGSRHLPDLTEWIALAALSAIPEAIGHLYTPGATVVVIPDAPLHTGDLAFPYHESISHVRMLKHDVSDLGLAHVEVVNTADHLPDGWSSEIMRQASEARLRAWSDPAFADNLRSLSRSLMFTTNTRAYGWSLEHSTLVNAVLGGWTERFPTEVVAEAEAIRSRTQTIVPYYVGVNRTLRTLDLPGAIVRHLSGSPNYLRLTAHAKPGEPRPMLTQNSSRGRPGLLPMHSLPLRFESGGRPRYANVFEVEARVNGYRPVTERATGRFLFYEEPEGTSSTACPGGVR